MPNPDPPPPSPAHGLALEYQKGAAPTLSPGLSTLLLFPNAGRPVNIFRHPETYDTGRLPLLNDGHIPKSLTGKGAALTVNSGNHEVAQPTEWSTDGLDYDSSFEEYERLRAACPVAHSNEYGGFWTLNGYEDVQQAAQNPQDFLSGRPFIKNSLRQRFIPLTLNSPEHEKYREILNPLFRPRRVASLEGDIRAAVRTYLDPMLRTGAGDFQKQVADPLPAHALCIFLGIPTTLVPELKSLSLENLTFRLDADRQAWVAKRMRALIAEVIDERRRNPRDPDVDFFSSLLAAKVDGNEIPPDELITIGHQMIGAGHDTTSHAMGSLIYRIATHPGEQARLRQNPALVASTIEEVLRVEPPLHHLGRETSRDIEVKGCPIPKDGAVTLNVAAANRDPAAFSDPDSVDFARTPNHHMTFGQGVHMCLGSRLARLELTAVLQELLERTSWVELAAPAKRTEIALSGFDSLPVKLVS